MIISSLVILGLCIGSFVNALVWRLHKQEERLAKAKNKSSEQYSITHGRSMCVHCKHQLKAIDLIPVFSWIALRGKCRYCKKPISWQYPFVELLTAVLFILSYNFWPSPLTSNLEPLTYIQFGLWLAVLVGLIALIVYDLRWMLLPNKIIFPLYALAALYVILEAIQTSDLRPLISTMLGIAVGGGIFYVLFQISEGRWIGGGDVKLGFLLGAFVGSPLQAMLLLFIASLLGCLVAVPLLMAGKAVRSTRIPFGPFLIAAGIITVLFGKSITDWYLSTLTMGV